MSIARAVRSARTLSGVLLLTCAATAQSGNPPATGISPPPAQDAGPATRATGQSVVASVNGVPITSTDVVYYGRLLVGAEETLDATAAHFVRRRLAEQILLSGETERLGVVLSDDEVEVYWERRFGEVPDFEASAASSGTTVIHQKQLARRQVGAELYTLHRVGLRGDHGHRISPDPILAREVAVTPGQLRDFFREHRAELDQPPTVSYAVYACPDATSADAVVDALAAGQLPIDRRPVLETLPLPALAEWFNFSPQLAEWLAEAGVGDVSTASIPDQGTLVVAVTGREEGQTAEFSKVQEELRRRIQAGLLTQAQERLVADLAQSAVYWPADLFKPETELSGQPDPNRPSRSTIPGQP